MSAAALTVSEARAILVANEAMDRLRRSRPSRALVLDPNEARAWQDLVESARSRVDEWERAQRST